MKKEVFTYMRREILAWIAALLAIVAYYLISEKTYTGWFINVISLSCWIVYGIKREIYPIVLVNVVLLIVNINGILVWRR